MLAFAVALTRSWTAFYTRGLPPDLRSRRREEIESDLWEQRRQAGSQRETQLGTALHILLRLVLGAPSDLVWRVETGSAVRSGKELNVNDKPWTVRRVLALIFFVAVMPIPASWIKSAATAVNPGAKEESTLSAVLLGVGGQACLMPIALGLMTIFWDGLAISAADFAEGSAEITVGVAALVGLYFARTTPAVGVALVAVSAVAMAFLATWALPGIIVIGLALAVMAVVRWFAPSPTPAMAT